MRIAILALQGAFVEHERMLQSLGADTFEIRNIEDWQQQKDGLVIPGGESTTMTKLLNDLQLMEPIREAIKGGLPVFGTCAGLIELAKLEHGEPTNRVSTMDIEVYRNAYGRQLGSFQTTASFKGIEKEVSMTFIRAPFINKVYGSAEVLAIVDGHIVAARQEKQLVTAFHPELGDDTAVHQYFIDMI